MGILDSLGGLLGSGPIADIAQRLGVSHGDAGQTLAQVLPQLIDHLTPQGQIPTDHGDMLAQTIATLHARAG